MGPDGVLAQLKASGLQGRGGAGFPAHVKWAAVRGQAETTRSVVVNADEGKPDNFIEMNRKDARRAGVKEGQPVRMTS